MKFGRPASDFNPNEIGVVTTLLDAAQQLLDLDSMIDPIKFKLEIQAHAVPAAEYAMRLWASAHGHSINEWRSGTDGTRTLQLFDRHQRMLVELHGAPPIERRGPLPPLECNCEWHRSLREVH